MCCFYNSQSIRCTKAAVQNAQLFVGKHHISSTLFDYHQMCVLFLQPIRCIGLHLFLLGKFPLSIAESTRPRPISFPLEGEDSHIHIYIYIYIYARMCGNWGGETFFVGEATNFVNIIWFSPNMCFVSTIRNPFGAFRMHSKMSSFSKEKQHISSTLFDYHQICVVSTIRSPFGALRMHFKMRSFS